MFVDCACKNKIIKIAKDCQATEASNRTIAFHPPKQALYTVENLRGAYKINRNNHHISFERVKFVHDDYANISYSWIEQDCYKLKSSEKSSNIIVLHLKNTNTKARNTGFTILFSHGNSVTLGNIYPSLYDLCSLLHCDILAYDYSGYGQSRGKPSEAEILSNIKDVASFAKDILKIQIPHLILCGQSIGSAPTVALSVAPEFENAAGVILISPISSGSKLVSPDVKSRILEKTDELSRINNIADVRCPILIIHGKKDEVSPVKHSVEMAKLMKIPYEWYPRYGDHNNIISKYRAKFIQKCKLFMEYLNHVSKKENDNRLLGNINIIRNEKLKKHNFYIQGHGEFLQIEENNIETSPSDHSNNNLCNYLNHEEKENDTRRLSINTLLNFIQPVAKFNMTPECPFDSRHSDEKSKKNQVNEADTADNRDSQEFAAVPCNNKEMESEYNLMMKKHHGI